MRAGVAYSVVLARLRVIGGHGVNLALLVALIIVVGERIEELTRRSWSSLKALTDRSLCALH